VLLAFDFDGTLMDTLRDLCEAASDLAESYGGRRFTEADTAAMVGDGAPLLVKRIMAAIGVAEVPADALHRYFVCYERRVFDHTAPYPGVVDMLAALAPAHRLTLLTNKPEAQAWAIMRHTGIEGYFADAVFGDGELPRKPDPAGLRWLMSRAGTDAAHTMMVGDSSMDLAAARNAGTRLCLARYGFGFERVPQAEIRPDDVLIDQPMDLVARLARESHRAD
jgi:phosphoglycolate phosphatase